MLLENKPTFQARCCKTPRARVTGARLFCQVLKWTAGTCTYGVSICSTSGSAGKQLSSKLSTALRLQSSFVAPMLGVASCSAGGKSWAWLRCNETLLQGLSINQCLRPAWSSPADVSDQLACWPSGCFCDGCTWTTQLRWAKVWNREQRLQMSHFSFKNMLLSHFISSLKTASQ